MYNESFHADRFAACELIVRPSSRSASLHNFFRPGNRALNTKHKHETVHD